VLLFDEGEDSSGGSDNNVWGLKALEELDVVLHGLTTEDNFGSYVFEVCCEADKLVLDLVSKFTSVAQNECRAGLGIFSHVLEYSQDENSGLSHTRDSLAEYIDSENSLGNTLLLDIGRVLKTTVLNCALQLGLEEHVLEGGCVDSNKSSGFGATVSLLTDTLDITEVVFFLTFNHEVFVVGEI
jgi:hypothetical protein